MALPEETGRNGENKPASKVRETHFYSTLDYSVMMLGRLIVALTCREDRAMLGSNPSAPQGSAGDS